MRRSDSVTMTIGLAVVVAMLLAITLERVVVPALPYFGVERRQELPKVEERFLVQLPGRVAALLDILDGTPVADRPVVLANAQLPQVRLRLLDVPAPNLGDRGEPDAEAMRPPAGPAFSSARPAASERPGCGSVLSREYRRVGDHCPCPGSPLVIGGGQEGRKAAF